MRLRRAFALALTILAVGAYAPVRANASAGTQVVPAAKLAAIADRVAHALVNDANRSVAPAFTLADQRVPAGNVQLEQAGSPFVSQTYVSVPVAIVVDGTLARTVLAGFRVTNYIKTAVAAHDLPTGEVLERDDITFARVASNGRPAVSAESLIGRRLLATTPSGGVLYVEATVPDILVRAGQPAILVVHDGPVALTADVVARTGGAIGDVVTVYNPSTAKLLSATVTGRDRVEFTLPGEQQ
jgi:flagella basal body P-ring formation protein FlgA